MAFVRRAIEVVGLAVLFSASGGALAAANLCQNAARDVFDASQTYRTAVRDVSVQCTKLATSCASARLAADAALTGLTAKNAEMMTLCVAPSPPPPPPGPGIGRGRLVLNEIDYDQPGTDTAEFVEIFNAGAEPAVLDGIAVVFVNGNGSTEYSRVSLSGTLAAGGYAVISGVGVTPAAGALVFPFMAPENNVQNGNPDGVAIVDTYTGALLDALSYGGYITSANIAGVGTVNLVEGVAPAQVIDYGSGPASLVRLPNGYDTDDASSDWKLSTTLTPGAPNVP